MLHLTLLILCHSCAAFVILMTAVPFVPSSQWWVRVWDFPRLQLGVIALASAIVFLFVWNPASPWHIGELIALLVIFAYQTYWEIPYTPITRVQVADASPHAARSPAAFTILISNVLVTNRDPSRLLALIEAHDPDVVFTVESNAWWIEQLVPVATKRPHTVLLASHEDYSMALYSRLPLHDVQVRELSRPGIPSIRADIELAAGHHATFYGLHPPPPFPGIQDESTPRDAELVIVAKEIESMDQPLIVAGDLNDVAWSHTSRLFQRISRMRDPRVGRGMYNSFHARYFSARWPLDHIILSRHFSLDAPSAERWVRSLSHPRQRRVAEQRRAELGRPRASRRRRPPRSRGNDRGKQQETLSVSAPRRSACGLFRRWRASRAARAAQIRACPWTP